MERAWSHTSSRDGSGLCPAARGLVAHTGYGQEEDKAKSEAAGFAQHLVKPVGILDLQNVLQQAAH